MKTKNTYDYPVKLSSKIKITYNESPAHKGQLKYAVDFIIPERTPIFASLNGIVVDVKQDSNISNPNKNYDKFGNYIEIKHKNGEYSIYEHIIQNGSLVKVGDKVKTGQLIGYSGKTGWIAHLGPHLHFDVHRYIGSGSEDYKTLEIRWKKPRKPF